MSKGDTVTSEDVQFSKYSIKKIGQRVGVDRMSDSAALRVALEQEREVGNLCQAAKVVADARGRETVKEDDIIRVKKVMGLMDNE